MNKLKIRYQYRATTYSQWKSQNLTCKMDEKRVLSWEEWYLMGNCVPIFCNKSTLKDKQSSESALNIAEPITVGTQIHYSCTSNLNLVAICNESREKHLTTEWNYPNGSCRSIIQTFHFLIKCSGCSVQN